MLQAELPDFVATWWPVMLETVPGSREVIAIAAIVRAASGQSQVRQLISPPALSGMFGDAAAGMRVVVIKTVLSIQAQLDAGVPVENVAMPFGGTELGTSRDCVGNSLNDVFEVAFKLGGAFGLSEFGVVRKPSDETRLAFAEWAEKVRTEVLSAGFEKLRDAFNVRVKLLAGKTARVGFVHGDYAANFGLLRPGRAPSDARALKVKIFDLEALRHSSPLVRRRTDIVIGYPEADASGAFSKRDLAAQSDWMDFIRSEALQRNVGVSHFSVVSAAARHIERAVA